MIAALMRKELSEWFVGGTTGKYGSWELAIFVLLTGIIMPIFLGTTKHSADPVTMVAFCLAVPLFLEVYAGADAFSGEQERGTLEWLYATPILSVQIVLGKWLAAVIYAMILGITSLTIASVIRMLLHGSSASFETYIGSVCLAVLGAAAMGGLATIVAISASSVRSAVSIFNIGFVALVLLLTQAPAIASIFGRIRLAPIITHYFALFPPLVVAGVLGSMVAAACLTVATKTVDRKRTD